MAYDFFGTSSPTIGPNAPFNETTAGCLQAAAGNPAGQTETVVSAVQNWYNAGMPYNQVSLPVHLHLLILLRVRVRVSSFFFVFPTQIVLGLPAYGHIFTLLDALPAGSTLQPYPAHNKIAPQGSPSEVLDTMPDVCGAVSNAYSGVYTFAGLVADGFLDQNGNGTAKAVGVRDACTDSVSAVSVRRMVSDLWFVALFVRGEHEEAHIV